MHVDCCHEFNGRHYPGRHCTCERTTDEAGPVPVPGWTCQQGSPQPAHDYEEPGQVIDPAQLPDLDDLPEAARKAYLANITVRQQPEPEREQGDG